MNKGAIQQAVGLLPLRPQATRDRLSKNPGEGGSLIMRLPAFSVTALVLALSANGLAQQRLVQHNDKDDPCRRFRIGILIPSEVADRELPVKRFAGGVDSKMVWNPCPTNMPQIAVVPFVPDKNDILLPKASFSFQSRPAETQRTSQDFLLSPPRFTFPQIWRRP